ncbi:nuclease domain-containing protein [Flavobacterium sp.]|uniref:nuclease domain-containing protein n=1 Tax=Flavobacterium sp. TaxID=239 RepID=UPI0039199BFB
MATLYEYWLFFTLYDLFKAKFKIKDIEHEEKSYNHLLEPTRDGLNIMVKQGKHTAIYGDFDTENRKLKVKFSYNRSFKGGTPYINEKGEINSGSYSTTLRPDYTLSVWPAILKEKEAEKQELIVHIHFDAKYKVTQFEIQTSTDNDLIEHEENNERKGIYKNADLLKMHAYKDAIRRSGGAYILYPGTEKKEIRGFHEIIPGLGAFSINPTGQNNDISELSKFIDLVINHLLDRASQRENISYRTHQIYQTNKDDSNLLHEPIPEYLNGKKIIPDDTFVLVGFYKDEDHYNWVKRKNLYNIRIDTRHGAIPLTNKELTSKYILLHTTGDKFSKELWEVKGEGVRVFSNDKMKKEGYETENSYLIFEIEKSNSVEFENVSWDFKKLEQYESKRQSGKPFCVSLSELMQVVVK